MSFVWQWERQGCAFCVYFAVFMSDVTFVVIWAWYGAPEHTWARPAQILIISPRDMSGSSVPVAGLCRALLGKVSPWPRSGHRSHQLMPSEAIRDTRCQQRGAGAFCCGDGFASWSKQNRDRVGDTGLGSHWSGTCSSGGRSVSEKNLLTVVCLLNILIFWILDYRILN